MPAGGIRIGRRLDRGLLIGVAGPVGHRRDSRITTPHPVCAAMVNPAAASYRGGVAGAAAANPVAGAGAASAVTIRRACGYTCR